MVTVSWPGDKNAMDKVIYTFYSSRYGQAFSSTVGF